MSAGQRFRFTPKRRKVQCSNCDEIFDNDYAFSALRWIKTYLWNTMAKQRLSNIAILSIERETTNFVEENMMDIIIDEFAKKNDDRARLLCHK